MRKGKFLIVNESIEECVDRKLQVSTENCDVFPALVYIPKFTKKMEKGMFCVLTIMAQILIYGVMGYFFKVGYLGLVGERRSFLNIKKKFRSLLKSRSCRCTEKNMSGCFVYR